MIAQAEAAIKESEIRVEELSKKQPTAKESDSKIDTKEQAILRNEEFRFDSYVKRRGPADIPSMGQEMPRGCFRRNS